MNEFLIFLALWSGSGILACLVFRRMGHNFLIFAGLALWMGPFIIYLMLYVTRADTPMITDQLRAGIPGEGWLDVLVGTDGSPESMDSVCAALQTLSPALRRVAIASALDAETARSRNAFTTDEDLADALAEVAERSNLPTASLVLLSGRADKALSAYATAEGFDVILVGHESFRIAGAILGSTIRRLAGNATVPVFVGPPKGHVIDLNAKRKPEINVEK